MRISELVKILNDIKEKFIMGFTKRQVICFGIGLVLGAPVYFLTRASIGMSGAICLPPHGGVKLI